MTELTQSASAAGGVPRLVEALRERYRRQLESVDGWARPFELRLPDRSSWPIGDGGEPAFTVSIAAGLIVTRSSSKADLGDEFTGQLTARPVTLAITAGFLGQNFLGKCLFSKNLLGIRFLGLRRVNHNPGKSK